MELSTYLDQAMSNLLKMSRTACGVVDVSASTNKKDYMAIESGKEAERYAQANFREAIRMCYDHRKDSYETPQELRAFLESVAVRINRGIVRDGVFFRIENSEKYSYVRAEEIPEEVDWFFRKLYGRLKADPVETAAFCEFCINLTGHYLADGCGKFSHACRYDAAGVQDQEGILCMESGTALQCGKRYAQTGSAALYGVLQDTFLIHSKKEGF